MIALKAMSAVLFLGLAACQTLPANEAEASAAATFGEGGESHPSLAFAQGACGGCHGVERFDLSPNVDAPPFATVANREPLTAATLATWLRDAHNYPQEMDFTMDREQITGLVDYIMTLRDPEYEPTIG
jgi:mono/diheme cytochrome c family protein